MLLPTRHQERQHLGPRSPSAAAVAAAAPRSPASTTAQLRDLRRALDGSATVRVTDCLDACERANVIVVQPSTAGRKAGGRPVWLGLVNDADATADITAWIEGGGPGLTEPPGILDLYAFKPSRRIRAELHDE